MEKDRHLARSAGCSGFIGKPVDVVELPQLVKNYIEKGKTAA
jgi:CheY-like chemotaxis protein